MMFPKGYYRLSGATKHFNFSQGRLDPEKVAPEIDPCHLAQGLGDFRYNSKCCLSIKVGKEWKYSSFIPKNCPTTNLVYSSFLLPSFFSISSCCHFFNCPGQSLRRGVRSDAQLSSTETRFQKCSQSGKNGYQYLWLSR